MIQFILAVGFNIYWFKQYGERGWKDMYNFDSHRPQWQTALTWAFSIWGVVGLFMGCC